MPSPIYSSSSSGSLTDCSVVSAVSSTNDNSTGSPSASNSTHAHYSPNSYSFSLSSNSLSSGSRCSTPGPLSISLPSSTTSRSSNGTISSPESEEANEDPLSDSQFFSPLYPDADISVCGAMCAIMQFCISHKLTYTAIGDLLKLLGLLCPSTSQLPTSFFKFKKFFETFNTVHKHKQVCTMCNKEECSCESNSSSNSAHIVHLDINGHWKIFFVVSYLTNLSSSLIIRSIKTTSAHHSLVSCLCMWLI